MAYADYSFYSDVYHGQMSEEDFLQFAGVSSAYINSVTFGRINSEALADERLGDKIKRACCACADIYSDFEKGKDISQERVGEYSCTFVQRTSSERDNSLSDAVKLYLGDCYWNGVKLMYRGV